MTEDGQKTSFSQSKLIATLHNENPTTGRRLNKKLDKELFRRLPVVGFSISKFLRTNVISRAGTTTTTKREETTTKTKIITRTRRCRPSPPIHSRNIFFAFQGSFPATALY
jgi:hypothetical protein